MNEYTHPLETVSSFKDLEEMTKRCPNCDSDKINLVIEELEDHKLHETLTCRFCGYTETN